MDRNKTIDLNRFYFIHDDSKTGHPGFIVWKNDELNRYLVVRTDSDKKGEKSKKERGLKHITELKHTISKNVERSYIRNRPMLCKRKDIGILLPDLFVHPDDMPKIIKVSKNKKEQSRSLRPRKKR